MKPYEYLLVEADAEIAIVTMNRADRRNALSLALMEELIDCFRALSEKEEIRAIILAASSDFSA